MSEKQLKLLLAIAKAVGTPEVVGLVYEVEQVEAFREELEINLFRRKAEHHLREAGL